MNDIDKKAELSRFRKEHERLREEARQREREQELVYARAAALSVVATLMAGVAPRMNRSMLCASADQLVPYIMDGKLPSEPS